ncbi:MAG: CO dehydrogenase/acetyl-CoA synthase subunit delta [Euryarchaeota archaeon]|nr:CO dehydrogenase/acetyl-CoA synthase subunit delta [Euryarchaeota archaeon]
MKIDELISQLLDAEEIELRNVSTTADELIFNLRSIAAPRKAAEAKLIEKERIKFGPPIKQYKGKIAEVQLGATRAEGGSRGKVVKLGGQTSLYHFEGGRKNKPVVAFDIFDIPMPSFPRVLRDIWSEVWDDPGEWAKKAVKLGTELITIHLISTDPLIKDTPPKEAAKTVEEVLQAVDVPLIVGGSGNPQKDPLVFERVAEVAEGEMLLLASANLDLDHKRIVDAANKHKHNVLSFTSMNITDQQALNKLLRDEGLPKERLVQDPTTGALGYGLDYTYSIIERLKQNALKGDDVLQNPIFCGVTNAWAAREAWMEEPAWGPREYRGLLWETVTALTVLNAGADGMMMLHPEAVKAVKEVIDSFRKEDGKHAIFLSKS